MFAHQDPYRTRPLPAGTMWWALGVASLDVVTVTVMLVAGRRLDGAGTAGALATLGSHHLVVAALAATSLLALLVVALLTSGFSRARSWQRGLLAISCLLAVAATATALAVAVVILVAALLLVRLVR